MKRLTITSGYPTEWKVGHRITILVKEGCRLHRKYCIITAINDENTVEVRFQRWFEIIVWNTVHLIRDGWCNLKRFASKIADALDC